MDPLAALTSLGDATRRRVYEHVAASAQAVTRDEVARAAGIGRTLAAYHLDRLAAEGLLEVSSERRSGGPGAGRPAKLYSRARREVSVNVPPRDYPLAARLLADAAADDPGGHVRRSLVSAAERLGHDIAAEAGSHTIEAVLRERGYEPYDDGGVTRMRNCPFHAVAQRQPELICDMNLALLRGLTEGLEGCCLSARLEPAPGRCCVALHQVAPAEITTHSGGPRPPLPGGGHRTRTTSMRADGRRRQRRPLPPPDDAP